MKHFSRTATLGAFAALLLLPVAAQAEIAPVPRPTTPTTVSPVVKPSVQPVHAPVQVTPAANTAVQATPVEHTTVQTSTPTTPTTQVVEHASPPALSSGGRAQVLIPVATSGGHADDEAPSAVVTTQQAAPPLPAPKLLPTKLVGVGHDPVPSYDAWPSWVLTVLTVLISAEAFLVVRLSRSRGRGRVVQSISV